MYCNIPIQLIRELGWIHQCLIAHLSCKLVLDLPLYTEISLAKICYCIHVVLALGGIYILCVSHQIIAPVAVCVLSLAIVIDTTLHLWSLAAMPSEIPR